MYAQVITAQIRPDRLDDLSRVFASADLGAPDGGAPGPRGHWLLLDRASCKCVALTLWASEADLRASQRAGLREAAALAGAPTREVFEVIE